MSSGASGWTIHGRSRPIPVVRSVLLRDASPAVAKTVDPAVAGGGLAQE